MSPRTFLFLALGGFITGGMAGCTIFQSGSSTILPSSAFFPVEPAELKPLQAIGRAQDIHMKHCHRGLSCVDAYYTRSLVALFENRADAISTFQELHTAMPNSRYDSAATGWLNLLQDRASSSSEARALLVQLRQEVLLKLLEHRDGIVEQSVQEHDRRMAEVNQ